MDSIAEVYIHCTYCFHEYIIALASFPGLCTAFVAFRGEPGIEAISALQFTYVEANCEIFHPPLIYLGYLYHRK